MNTVTSYKDLEVWQRSIALVRDIYVLTRRLPKEELYALTSQIRRSAISIPSNIAEGAERKGTKELMRFISIALSSAAELETQLIIVEEVGYVEDVSKVIQELIVIKKMLNSLLSSLRNKLSGGVNDN